MTKARIFDVKHYAVHDGPGIRTTFFLMGCPLRCLWCQNPESQKDETVITFTPMKCIGCGHCYEACGKLNEQLQLPSANCAENVFPCVTPAQELLEASSGLPRKL